MESPKVAGLKAYNSIIKKLQHKCFFVNIAKFLRAPVIKKIRQRLLLKLMQGPKAAIRGAL